jgi:hypothetical protein
MAAATGDRNAQRSDGRLLALLVDDGDILYKGTMIGANVAGYQVPMLHSVAGLRFAGVTAESANNTGGADGAITVLAERTGVFSFVYNGGDATQALLFLRVYAVDNQTVDEDPATVTNQYPVGIIVKVESGSEVRVQIDGFVTAPPAIGASSAAVAALTDNSGGTADDTLQSIGAAYSQAEVRNNFADLAAKVNALRAVMVEQGTISS